MNWYPPYDLLVAQDLEDSERACIKPLTSLRARLSAPAQDWGALYELHFLAMCARAGTLMDHEVPTQSGSGRNFDVLTGLGEQRIACEVLTVRAEDFWPHKGFDAEVSRQVSERIAGLDVCLTLMRQPNRGVDERRVALLVCDIVDAYKEGRNEGSSVYGRFASNEPGEYGVANSSPVSLVIVRPGCGCLSVIAGSESEPLPPDFYAADLRPKVEAKKSQLPDDMPGLIVMGTVQAFRHEDVAFLARESDHCIFHTLGTRVVGILWFTLGREPSQGAVVEVVPGLYRSSALYWNPYVYPGMLRSIIYAQRG